MDKDEIKSPHRQHKLPVGADFRGTTLICLFSRRIR